MGLGKVNKKLLIVVGVWSSFTIALLTWWVIFSFKQFETLKALNIKKNTEILKHQKMLIYEGITLYSCLIFGAGLLVWFIYKENTRLRERRDFLSSFNHDLKTTITSLRLRIERLLSLSSDGEGDSPVHIEAVEIQKIGTRLNQQLQNALNMSYETSSLYIETVNLKKELEYIKPLWPDLELLIKGDLVVQADSPLLRSVLSNIIQNFYDHAHSKKVSVYEGESLKNGMIKIHFESLDGEPFKGDMKKFSETLTYKRSVDSSGLGLKLSKKIMESFKGAISFYKSNNQSLAVSLLFFKKEGGL